MCEVIVVTTADGHIRGTHDWVKGFKPLVCPHRSSSENDVLARALYLERHGLPEEANDLLEKYLRERH